MITETTYGDLNTAYMFFNERLFENRLPDCLITYQRKNYAYGFFYGNRFTTRDGGATTDEIALNPTHFLSRTTEQILSTLVHEMVHQWQHHEGSPSRSGYHNREWVDKMISIGLTPSDTGGPGGRKTGQKVSHYITPGGRFERACAELTAQGVNIRYVDREVPSDKKKPESKTRYQCPSCSVKAWAKPNIGLICDTCETYLIPQDRRSSQFPALF